MIHEFYAMVFRFFRPRRFAQVADRSVPVVFSNSVIEHVGDAAAQQAFADELRRVGRKLRVQTPAWIFPFELQLLAPFVGWVTRLWHIAVRR